MFHQTQFCVAHDVTHPDPAEHHIRVIAMHGPTLVERIFDGEGNLTRERELCDTSHPLYPEFRSHLSAVDKTLHQIRQT